MQNAQQAVKDLVGTRSTGSRFRLMIYFLLLARVILVAFNWADNFIHRYSIRAIIHPELPPFATFPRGYSSHIILRSARAAGEHIQSMLKEQTHDLVPLIDDCVMNDWCGDLSKEDVLDILASVPDECRKCVIEIERAIDEGHLAEAKRVAHRLKGMAGNLGAARLAQIARSLELKSENIEDVSKGMSELRRILDETLAALCSSS